MGRPPCCDKSNVKRGLWTAEEDAKILAYVAIHGTGNWTLVPKKAGLNRCGKSCRLRWTNYLRPDLKHDSFTPQEEEIIINLHKAIGSRWSLIAKRLPGRTDNDVKNYWNTKLKKKLSKIGIDPVTHKPVSQVLSDYGNISGLSNTANSFGKNISHNSFLSKAQTSSVRNELQSTMMTKQSKPELYQDNSSVTSNPFWDLTAHPFQAPIQPHFVVTSSCSSSSSSAITRLSSAPHYSYPCQQSEAQIIIPSSPFSWSEFLICDPNLSVDLQQKKHQQQQRHEPPQGMSSSTNSTLTSYETSGFNFVSRNEHVFDKFDHGLCSGAFNHRANNGNQVNKNADAVLSSSTSSSFVDAILKKDCEMSSQLFELLDGSFDY